MTACRKGLVCFFCVLYALSGYAQNRSPAQATDSIAGLHLSRARQYFSKLQPDSAFLQLSDARTLYRQTGNKMGLASMRMVIANYSLKNYLPRLADSNYVLADSLLDTLQNAALRGEIYAGRAEIRFQEKAYAQALAYDEKAAESFKNGRLINRLADTYVHTAAILQRMGRYQEAERLILKNALSLYRSASNTPGRIGCFQVLGEIYYSQNRNSEAKWFFIQANTLGRTLNDKDAIVNSLVGMGKVKTKIKDYGLAMRDLKEARSLATAAGLLRRLSDVQYGLSTHYQKTGDDKQSRQSLSLHHYWKTFAAGLEQKQAAQALVRLSAFEKEPVAAAKKKAPSSPVPLPSGHPVWPYIVILLLLMAGIILFLRFKRKRQE